MIKNSEKTPTGITLEYSFQHSYNCLPKNKLREVRDKIKKIIGSNTENSAYDRIAGKIEPRVSEAKEIERLFKSYGIKVEWGKTPAK